MRKMRFHLLVLRISKLRTPQIPEKEKKAGENFLFLSGNMLANYL
jgi:hypothetical protein